MKTFLLALVITLAGCAAFQKATSGEELPPPGERTQVEEDAAAIRGAANTIADTGEVISTAAPFPTNIVALAAFAALRGLFGVRPPQ